jgi:hypothetical protein
MAWHVVIVNYKADAAQCHKKQCVFKVIAIMIIWQAMNPASLLSE